MNSMWKEEKWGKTKDEMAGRGRKFCWECKLGIKKHKPEVVGKEIIKTFTQQWIENILG